MPNIRIKQLESRVATQGIHFGLGRKARKLEPGEIVEMDGESELFAAIYATGKVEITPDEANRPLIYETEDEARYCSPSFKARDDSEERDAAIAIETVAARLSKPAESKAESKPARVETKPAKKKVAAKKTSPGVSRRAKRRQNIEASHGEEVST